MSLDPGFGAIYARRGYRAQDEALPAGATPLLAPGARLSYGLGGEDGWIGHYEAEDAAQGRALLAQACAALKARGAKRAYGPLNGSTWHRYRLALPGEGAESPPFLGEPENPRGYALDFQAAGFSQAESYQSREALISDGLPHAESLPKRVQARYAPLIRPLNLGRYDDELKLIYGEAVESFGHNALYAPASLDEFLAIFGPLKALYDPELVRLCVDAQGRLLGHVAAYPDGKRVILKTLSVRKEHRGRGLAHLLAYQVHDLAREKGYLSVVHALMHDGNKSQGMSEPFGRLIRRYALFSRKL
jgi:predicted GNAT family acetyltransferase